MWTTIKICLITIISLKVTTNVSAADNEAEPFPDFFSFFGEAGFFHSSVKVISRTTDEFFYIEEFLNIKTGQGRLNLKLKQEKDIIYLKKTGEVFSIADDECSTTNIEDPSFDKFKITNTSIVPKWNNMIGQYRSSLTLFGPSTSLLIPNTDNTKYLGKFNNVSSWECVEGNILILFKYTETPGQPSLWIEIKSSDPDEALQYIYDYMSYGLDEIDQSHVDIPVGYGCERNYSKLPTSPSFEQENFKYSVEILDTSKKEGSSNFICIATSIQDKSNHLNGFSYREWNGKTFEDSILKIYEQNSGFQYTKDISTGSCQYEKILTYEETIPLPHHMKFDLRDPIFLRDPSGFSLIKEGVEDGIPAYYYEGKFGNAMVITRIYSKESVLNEEARTKKILPLRVIVKPIGEQKKKVYAPILLTFFDLSMKPVQWRRLYDIGSCFITKYVPLKLSFRVKNHDEQVALMNYAEEVESSIISKLYTGGDINPLRISHFMPYFDKYFMNIHIHLLDRPPALEDFERREAYFNPKYDRMYELVDTEECAQHCLSSDTECKYFSLCGHFCYLYYSSDADNNLDPEEYCNFYEKKEDASSISTIPTVLKKLQLLFDENDFEIIFHVVVNDDFKPLTYPLEKFEFPLVRDKKRRHIDEFEYKFKFYKDQRIKFKPSFSKITRNATYVNCQQLCLNDPQCKSFSSCYNDECIITTKGEISLEDVELNPQCLIVIKQDLSNYKEMDGFYELVEEEGPLEVENIEDCAKECSDNQNFTCHSFDVCPKSSAPLLDCILHSSYRTDTKIENAARVVCSRFQRDYIVDFTVNTKQRKEGQSIDQIVGEDHRKCAKLCLAGTFCRGFDFCQEDVSTNTKCVFYSEHGDKFVPDDTCDNYEKRTFVELEDDRPAMQSIHIVIGAGVLSLIIGICTGVALCIARQRRRSDIVV